MTYDKEMSYRENVALAVLVAGFIPPYLVAAIAVVAVRSYKKHRAMRRRPGVFPFLELPIELRLLCYQKAFESSDLDPLRPVAHPWKCRSQALPRFYSLKKQDHGWFPKNDSCVALLRTNRQIYYEALPYLYKNATFHVIMAPGGCMGPFHKRGVRRVELYNRRRADAIQRSLDEQSTSQFAARHMKRFRIVVRSLPKCECPSKNYHVAEAGFSGLLQLVQNLEEIELKFLDESAFVDFADRLNRKKLGTLPAIFNVVRCSGCRITVILPTTENYWPVHLGLPLGISGKGRSVMGNISAFFNDTSSPTLKIKFVVNNEDDTYYKTRWALI